MGIERWTLLIKCFPYAITWEKWRQNGQDVNQFRKRDKSVPRREQIRNIHKSSQKSCKELLFELRDM